MNVFRVSIVVLATIAFSLLGGCNLLGVKEQQEKSEAYCQLRGSVRAERSENGVLVVVLLRHKGGSIEQRSQWDLVDHFSLAQAGNWFFSASPGTYYLTAFQDINHNQVFERDEPAIPIDLNKVFSCNPGAITSDWRLVIPEAGRIPGETSVDIAKLQVRSATEQLHVSLGQTLAVGELTSLKDPRFSRENAHEGLWRPFDFIWEIRPGIYFLGPYDPGKTPVLFVHGMNGTPIDFSYLIDRLDRSRFQPWVFYYPSGARLDRLGTYLAQMVTELKIKHRFSRLFLVAHSMGGLVSRHALLKREEMAHGPLIPLFVTIASPWNGHRAAQLGVEHAPTPVYSWVDMAPGSKFLTQLFYDSKGSGRRQLPADMAHHLIFTFLPTKSGDGTVSLESQLREEAQDEASRLYGFSQTHTGVLEAAKTSALLNRLLLVGSATRPQ